MKNVKCAECGESMHPAFWGVRGATWRSPARVHACPWDIPVIAGESFEAYRERRKNARREWESANGPKVD